MDKAEATEALISNVRLKYQTCDVRNYKTKTQVINKCGKTKSKYTYNHCHERVVLF